MMVKYKIYVRDKEGTYISELTDIINLSITDTLNDLGSWKITSRTKGEHPFLPGSGIVIYREGVYLYSGFMDKVDAELNYDGSWSWTASGKGDLEALKWRVIFPDPTIANPMVSRYDIYDKTQFYIVGIANALIQKNASYTADANRGGALTIVGEPDVEYPITLTHSEEDKTYRLENLFDTVKKLMNEGKHVIRVTWDEATHKIIYVFTDGRDLSANVVFSWERNDISSVHQIMKSPDYTRLIYQFNSDKYYTNPNQEMWRYLEKANLLDPLSDQLLGGRWLIRERAVAANDQDFDGEYIDAVLFDLVSAAAKKEKVYTEGYEIEFQSSGNAPIYQADYKLGDIISVEFPGKTVTGQVTKVTIDYSCGNESIKPSIDAYDTGAAGSLKADVKQIGDDVSKMMTREV